MATRKLDKNLVMAQCVAIMQRQSRNTRHPRMRAAIDNAIDYFGTPGRADEYGMIVYTNAITLVHRNYENRPNLTLYPDGKLLIARFDSWLKFDDPRCIRIHGDGTADCGVSNHGIMTGECLTEKLAYNQGKEIKYSYNPQPLPFYLQRGDSVDNDDSLNLFGRLTRNRTIGRKDFLVGSLILFALFYLCSGIGMTVMQHNELLGQFIVGAGGLLLFIAGIVLVVKRVGDLGFFGIPRVLAIAVMLVCPVLLLLLLVMKTRVISEYQSEAARKKRQELHDEARRALARRCDVSDYTPDWFAASPEALRSAGRSGTPHRPAPCDEREEERRREEQERDRREEERREEERREEERREAERQREEEYERECRRNELDRQIGVLRSQLSSEEHRLNCARSEYDRARQQADTYLSYARSTDDESLRRDYEQSADSYLSDARSAESDASDAASRIADLQNEISCLESERSGL